MSGPETGSLASNRTVDVVHSINNGVDEGLRLANRTWPHATGANQHFCQGACRKDEVVAS